MRKTHGRGGALVGVHRAVQLAHRQPLSVDTLKRMWSYFRRRRVDRKAPGFFGGPSFPSAGRFAWDLWGGDVGLRWAESVLNRLDA
jgi:hypothetical protein